MSRTSSELPVIRLINQASCETDKITQLSTEMHRSGDAIHLIYCHVQKGRRLAVMKTWKLSHTDGCDCGERQTMSHLMTCVDGPIERGQTWLYQPLPVSTVPNTGRSPGVEFRQKIYLSNGQVDLQNHLSVMKSTCPTKEKHKIKRLFNVAP